MLYARVVIGQARTGLFYAQVTTGFREFSVLGCLSVNQARALASDRAAALGRKAYFVN